VRENCSPGSVRGAAPLRGRPYRDRVGTSRNLGAEARGVRAPGDGDSAVTCSIGIAYVAQMRCDQCSDFNGRALSSSAGD
jgi:hypothetical protein